MAQQDKEDELSKDMRTLTLQQNEYIYKHINFERRRKLEQGLDEEIRTKHEKARQEKKENFEGPTTLNEL